MIPKIVYFPELMGVFLNMLDHCKV